MSDQSSAVETLGLLSSDDFLFTTRILDTARELQKQMLLRKSIAEVTDVCERTSVQLWIIDLDSSSGVLDAVPQILQQFPDLHLIAFGSHVDVARLRLAREAGCHTVIPRSKMTTDLVDYLTSYL